jgi:hypothetical protein
MLVGRGRDDDKEAKGLQWASGGNLLTSERTRGVCGKWWRKREGGCKMM